MPSSINNQRRESVWDYPRPPRLEVFSGHLHVEHQGITLADADRVWRILETSHPPVYYIPPEFIRMDLLHLNEGHSVCEWKGISSFYDLVLEEQVIRNVAWCYLQPEQQYRALVGCLAFYPSKLDRCSIDGEMVQAQEGDFYGGWITSNIIGPFKGGPGTWGW